MDGLDLTAFYAPYERDGRRNAPQDPRMMVKVLLYGYATGVFSSRRIARKLEEDVGFRMLAADNFPQHRTLCELRRRHLTDFQALFVEVVCLARVPRTCGDKASRTTRDTLVASEPDSMAASPERGATDTAQRRRMPMATTEHAVKLTYDDYCRTPDDERYELLNGELMMVPAPNTKHQLVQGKLLGELGRFARGHGLGKVLGAPFEVVLSDTNLVQPDVLFISRAREDRLTEQNLRGAPDLVIEILSPSTAKVDVGQKYDLYGRHGVLEYWIVDPVAETIAVHRQRDGGLEPVATFGRGENLATAVLEGLALELDDLFAS